MPLNQPSSALLNASWKRILISHVIGAAGGAIFYYFSLPLPWMLGAMLFTFTAVMLGLPAQTIHKLRTPVIAIIGVMLGSGFTAEILASAGGWIVSLAFLAFYMAVAAALLVPIYTRIGGYDRNTAYFAAMPGGVNDMVIIGEAMGADGRRIALAHAARIVITIAVVAFWFRVVLGLEVSGNLSNGNYDPMGLRDFLLMTGCAVFGTIMGKKLKFPAHALLGPMVLSALVHVTDMTHSVPPSLLVNICQVFLGTALGVRFVGTPKGMVARSMRLSFVATLITLALTLIFAVAFHTLFDQTTEQVILAYAPGGLTEMSLVALSMGADVAYISVHHLARITMVIAFAPIILKLMLRRGI